VDRIECQFCKSQNEAERTSCLNCGAPLDVTDIVRISRTTATSGAYDSAPPKPGSWGGRSV
jgi:predicted amidophosphoribosyltransferase